jgi:acetylornithine/succinyldiaminopimelate/putrescine aminotransferase
MGNTSFRAPFDPLIGPVRHLRFNDEQALDAIDDQVAAVVLEPVQAEGGVRIPSRGFIEALRRRCDETGSLLMFDEVLTGLGRTGRLFAFEHFGVVPDLLILAKALGGGMPLGAFCGSDELLGCLAHDPPLGHITTFGGHPLSCAAGAAALQVIVDERLFERARQNGAILLEWLRNLVGDEITDVRGIGLLLGIEFAEAAIARRFVAETIARGVVVNWTLNADRVVRLAPPLTIEIDELRFALGAMEEALDAVQRNPRETQNG